MATFFLKTATIVAAPNDANDGLCPIGFNLSGATFTNATKRLTKTGAFAGYTWAAGHVIGGLAGTGVTETVAPIAAKISDDEVELSIDIGGTNPTDVSSGDGPFATVDHALNDAGAGNSMAAGDELRICNDGDHEISDQINYQSAGGTASARITVRAAQAGGAKFANSLDEANRVTIRPAVGAFTGSYLLWPESIRTNFIGITLNCKDSGGTRRVNRCVFDGVAAGTRWINCRFTQANDSVGAFLSGFRNTYSFCEFDSNAGGPGFWDNASSSQGKHLFNKFHNNSTHGLRSTQASEFLSIHQCEFYSNGSRGVSLETASESEAEITNSVFDGNGGDGLFVNHPPFRGNGAINGNSFSSNGGYGVNVASGNQDAWADLVDFNHFHSNTSGETNYSDGTPGDNNVSGDPLFADAANGDFTPGAGSPLIGAGPLGSNIGTVAHAEGGGGGLLTHPGMNGGIRG